MLGSFLQEAKSEFASKVAFRKIALISNGMLSSKKSGKYGRLFLKQPAVKYGIYTGVGWAGAACVTRIIPWDSCK